MSGKLKVGGIYNEPMSLRQVVLDWRRENDPFWTSEREPFRTEGLIVPVRPDYGLILEPRSQTAVRCHDDRRYVGGGGWSGSLWYERLAAPEVVVILSRGEHDPFYHPAVKESDPLTWPHSVRLWGKNSCPRHDPAWQNRGWQVLLPGEEPEEWLVGQHVYAARKMKQMEFVSYLGTLPCFCDH